MDNKSRIGYVLLTLSISVLGLSFMWSTSNASTGLRSDSVTSHTTSDNNQALIPQVSPTPECGLAWRTVSNPTPGLGGQFLGVAVNSASDVWAVGYYGSSSGLVQTLVEHWDGTQWSVVSSPNVQSTDNRLLAADAVSPNDVWAVGYYRDELDRPFTLTLHWNGTQWSVIPSPNGIFSNNILSAVAAVSTNDVWAVGTTGVNNLALHWNGTQWSTVPIPNSGSGSHNVLTGLTAISANDIWAVGNYDTGNGFEQTRTIHWDGTQWTIIPSPNPQNDGNYLRGVAGIASNDVWAVGYSDNGTGAQTLVEHWDGTAWSIVPSPNVSSGPNELNAVTALAANNVWAVGTYGSATALVEHWDGTQWSIDPSAEAASLQDVEAVSALDIWAVGSSFNSGGQPRTMRYNDPCQNVTPTIIPTSTVQPSSTSTSTPNATSTSTSTNTVVPTIMPTFTALPSSTITPNVTSTSTNTVIPGTATSTAPVSTNTPVPPSATGTAVSTSISTSTPTSMSTATSLPTSTAIPCTIQFSDVDENNTFYQSIRCLACRGIISGYSDGTFRPNNQVTRGQLAKIVSNAAGFTEDPNPQIFEDVPPSNTFYEWVNRLARRGHMSGYVCGGAGEPCISGMPYFRPFANATRGQTSKIVSNAAGYSEIPTTQTFEDVPPTHTFYREIQRLASRNIMQGYPCGGAGEPCISGKPYFRPQNNVTRGQSAKIVANTFYPGCQTP
jgi:hypothetical protein